MTNFITQGGAPDYCLEISALEKGYSFICGVDEVGRGPLAGPVVAASVILDPQLFSYNSTKHPLLGLRDSKQLNKSQRDYFYDAIFKVSLAITITSLAAATIDKENILQASLRAMKTTVTQSAIMPDYALFDGRDMPPGLAIEGSAIIKGDQKSLSIAAASVIAKVTRDRLMHALHERFPAYGFERNVGYPTKAHREAIAQHGIIPSIHRLTFGSVKGYKLHEDRHDGNPS